MKLSVSAFRAQASAQRKILSSYKSQLNYGACTSLPAVGSYALEERVQMMVDSTAITPAAPTKPQQQQQQCQHKQPDADGMDKQPSDAPPTKREQTTLLDKSPGRTRSKSNQRWMKLRTTVQLSGAITNTNQKPKPPLKREDSFLKRFSTRQIPETQETVDTGDETEPHSGGPHTQNEVNRRRRKRRKEMSKTVVNPDENFYFYWLMTVTVCVLYNLWTLIVRQSFPELQKSASAFWYSGDGFTDLVFLCDIMVQFRTGYLEQGLMVYNSRKLASHYLKSRAFVLDTLSLLPLDFLQLRLGVNPLLRFPRFLKVYRVYNYYYMVESRTVYPNLWRVVNLIHILLILAHWFGCFYFLLSEAEGFQGDWVYPHRPGDYATLTRKYLASLYWSTLTLTTIGDLPTPETNAESRGRGKAMTSSGQSEGVPRRGHKSRLLQFNSNYGYLFTIISYLIGVFIFATIVGQVGNVITNRNANRLEFERLLDGAKTYMRHHKVPGGMKRRVLRWYDYSWSRGRIQGGGDINTALGLLPDKLKTELALHVNLSVLKKVTIFQECQPEFLHDLVLKMKAYIFTPGDLICRKGEVAREMFIIADGILDVISETGRVLTTMKAGDFFGEIGILNLDGLNKRTADVRSVGYSELFSLSREDVLAAMKDYPEAQEILQSLGRKRLMEAKNASKMHKAQAKQAKDHDSSGDSDTAGKRIVEKLRSDVKGLKKALRRSRRGTGSKMSGDVISGPSAKKHSILRRMSHVQSSDECEAVVDADHSPIGASLPLLQRLKLLKERQDKELHDSDTPNSSSIPHGSPHARGDAGGPETNSGRPLRQKLKLLKQKEIKETMATGFGLVPSTVRTQLTGLKLDRTTARATTQRCPKDNEETSEKVGEEEEEEKTQGRIPLKERLKAREKSLPWASNQEEGTVSSGSNSGNAIPNSSVLKTSINVPTAKEAENTVPKLVRSIPEVPVSKDGWKLLKKCSVSCSERKSNGGEETAGKKVTKKGTYLSKSDTVLERQKTVQKDEEKRSRSISPSNGSDTHKRTPEHSPGDRRRSRSVGHSPRLGEPESGTTTWDLPDSPAPETGRERRRKMKKYNSISDLSPEYSGLPFVKKLKILNERQKLEELEGELVVRSASLDVTEKPKKGNVLVRSHSESASAGEYRRGDIGGQQQFERRSTQCSEGSIASPESNETLERRHLKSILKKLSAEEGGMSDEERGMVGSGGGGGVGGVRRGRGGVSRREDRAELKKLMREPTLEGYAARHKKLTKSVTFDSDTLPSPLDVLLEQPSEEAKGRGYSPNSPTAILTLQLSNLSMMPIASPKKSTTKPEGPRDREHIDRRGTTHLQPTAAAIPQQEENQPNAHTSRLMNKQKHNLSTPSSLQELTDAAVVFPLAGNPREQFFSEIEGEVLEIIRQILEKAHANFESRFRILQGEVERRDEMIVRLQTRIQQLERKCLQQDQNEDDAAVRKNSESSATDSDLSDVPFQREDSCETVWDVGWAFDPGGSAVGSREEAGDCWNAESSPVSPTQQDELSDLPSSDHLGNIPLDRETRNSWEGVRLLGQTTAEEVELRELSEPFPGGEGASRRSVSESAPKGFLNRMNKLQRSISGCREKNAGFVALDIDDSSKSSDVENGDNKDWEVQMLVEELAKKDSYWGVEEGEWDSQAGEEEEEEEEKLELELEGVEKLREEVNTLKRVVCDSDLSRLTNSELDILEGILEAKDRKILQIVKSNSLDHDGKAQKGKSNSTATAQNKTKDGEQLKKSSLKHKIGQALSFDFHDMDGRGVKVFRSVKHGRSYLRTQKTISGSHREHQSLYSLWRTSALLRNRVLDDSERIIQTPAVSSPTSPTSRSSLLVSTCPRLRTSLPLLSGRDFEERHVTQQRDSLLQQPEAPGFNSPSTSGTSGSSLNSFIKSVGQRVKQVMVGDVTAVREQVPTISKLLEEQSNVNGTEGGGGGVGCEKLEGSGEEEERGPGREFPKTEPPEL